VAAALEHWLPIMFEDTTQILDIAREAEAAGFTGVALADHVAIPVDFTSVHPSGDSPFVPTSEFLDPMATAASILAVTTRLRVMTYVYIVTMRDPWSVAKAAGTLSVLSGGRFALGVGAGWLTEEIALLGHDPATRGKRMERDLDLIRGLLYTGSATAPGGREVAMAPVPASPPPILVGGKARAALRRAARHDGWLGMNYPLDEVWQLLDDLARAREEAESAPHPSSQPPMTMVIPEVLPSPGLHAELAARGVTATISMPWYPGDPSVASLDGKRDALRAWAQQYGLHAGSELA
jgi:alkanesulfonate monooxygenase SsuD/methylene tetrahydromethanopterin reductase-like flavin-dependent oxidoreductase (luciferase family)